ncbi:plasmid replication initiator TrfA [Paraburkholderia youngii]|uniref:plasmid replication initiator TrfA n=1 Tax=Paraburkholderia youngii TaxID=2782701 RepID=UPI001591BD5E|nr:plasmid replication initiator TrfA [Paraburkholderia youngii]NUX58705.1 hypothetical protein [Paraburkholderia youngii]
MVKTALAIAQRLQAENTRGSLQPTWGDDKRAVSKQLARSALFRVADPRKAREQFKDARVASWVRTEIRYSGEELRQDDQDVFMQLVHVMRKQELGNQVVVFGSDLLSALKWSDSQEQYDRLFHCIKRMLEGTVWVWNPDNRGTKLYGTHLIQSVEALDADAAHKQQPDDEGLNPRRTIWRLHLDPSLANIMTDDNLTLVDWVRHLSLTPMAKWFHVFYSTHREPYAMSPKLFKELSGSKQKNLATFRQRIHKTLNELIEKGFLESYDYNAENDTFDVKRKPEAAPKVPKRGQLDLPLS